jgi:hypothetical protein
MHRTCFLPKFRMVAILGTSLCSAGLALAWPGREPMVPASARRDNLPVPDISSPLMPSDVSIPATAPGNPIAFFDDFSWRSFIAAVWPAQDGQRGIPNTSQTVNTMGVPRVFETYKATWEIFHADGTDPAAWNDYEQARFNPGGQSVHFGDIVLASFSKFSDIGQAGFGNLVGPITSQNGKYVHYLTGFNKTEFDPIVANKWYQRANLPATLTLPDGAIDMKSSWIDMTGIAHPERYYTRQAFVLNLQTGAMEQKTVGLVGLHIVQKTRSRPQWIWSSFEHVDNVPPSQAVGADKFTFNNGTSSPPMPASSPFPLDPPTPDTPPLIPFNVKRIQPIHDSTQQTNMLYRNALKQRNSVWQFYQLVMTQWPVPPQGQTTVPPDMAGTPDHTFPGTNATTCFANTTLETFEQNNVRTGCMNCHNFTRVNTDFVWTLKDHAFPPNVPALLTRDRPFHSLQTLLKEAHQPRTHSLPNAIPHRSTQKPRSK